MPTPTDTLDATVKLTNEQLHELSQKFDQFRVDIAVQLGTLNANLEGFRGRTEVSLAVATWTVRIVVPIITTVVLGLVAWSYSAFDRAARLESAAGRLEASIVELRDHAKEQDQRIARTVDMITALTKGSRP